MKKALVLLLACLMAVNVSAQKTKSSSTAVKKATTSKTTAKKTSSTKKSSTPDGLLEKGTFFFNTNATNVSFNYISIGSKNGGKSENLTRFGLQAQGGYAISRNLAAVAGVGYQFGKMESNSLNVFNLTGGVRYYIIPNLYASGMLVVGFTGVNADTSDLSDDPDDLPSGSMKGHTIGMDLGVGYSYWLTKRVAIEPNLSYSIGLSTKFEDSEVKMNVLTFNIGFTILL